MGVALLCVLGLRLPLLQAFQQLSHAFFFLYNFTAGRVKQINFKMKKSLFTAFVVGLGLTASLWAQVPSYVPTNGLVGWWPFNGNANDESGNGNNGTVNGAMLTADRFENVDKAYSFDGNQNILVQHSNSFNMSSNFSISLWFTVKDFNNVRTLINKNSIGNGNLDYFNIGILPNSGILYTQFGDGNSTDNILCPNIPNLNLWYNAIFTVSDSVKFFVNGQLIESHLRTISPLENTENLSFGYWQTQSHTYHMGKLDDIGIWNRSLTQQEITALYNGCSTSTISAQPTNQTVNSTNSAQFIVNASSGSSFQWQTDLGLGFQNLINAGQYSGVNNDTLVVSNATVSNNNQQFRCIVNSGSCSDTSDIAVLTVSTSGIEELNLSKFNLYPNPTQSSFEIQTNLVFNKIEIRDMQGRVVKTENAGKIINIASLQKGTYLVQLIDEKSKVIAVQRIIKE